MVFVHTAGRHFDLNTLIQFKMITTVNLLYQTKDSLADICKLHPHKVIQAFEDIDTGNTERVTMATLQQILFR